MLAPNHPDYSPLFGKLRNEQSKQPCAVCGRKRVLKARICRPCSKHRDEFAELREQYRANHGV